MIVTYSNRTYRITYQSISLVENALGNPNLIQISLTSDCEVKVSPMSEYGITYLPNGEYRSWQLTGINTKLNRKEQHFIYARLERDGKNGLLVFSVNDYNVDGTIGENKIPSEYYYYIKLGKITETDAVDNATEMREITLDYGYLATPADMDNSGSSWNDLFELTIDGFIRPLKRFTSYIVQGTLNIIGKFTLNDKEVNDIVRDADQDKFVASDESLPTTKFLIGKFIDELKKIFLRKDQEDETKFLLRMLGGAHFYSYTQGMIGGSGAAFYKNPDTGKVYMEADGAYLREELVVPKITFNCIDVISGDKANTFAYGTIKSVDKQNMIADLDLLEDERGTLHVDDICRGVFHNIEGENDIDDMEDENGFYHYSGFSTSYFTPVEILDNKLGELRFRYVLQAGTSIHPMPGMNFFAYGNFRDKSRQAITYETRYYTRRIKNVDTWAINPTKNISMQDGLLDGLVIGGMVMKGYGTFQENCYFTGVNIQFTPDQEEAMRGESAYSVSLSSYERVVKMDSEGNIVSLLKELNVISNPNNVTTGDKNVITTQPKIQTYIQVTKGTETLLYSDIVEKGKYIVTITEHGCKASVENGILSIEKITGKDNCYVDLLINCEGNVTFEKTFSVSIIRDGSSNIVVDLDNEMASVATDAEGKVIAGLPLETNVSVYLGSEKQEITNIELDAPSGVTANSDTSTGKITITEIEDSVPESIEIAIKVYFSHDNIAESRVVKFNVAKVKGGENAVIYQLSPSVTAIKVNKEGEYDHGTVSCYINMINGEKITTLDKTPSGLSMRYEIDNNIENEYTYGNSISINEVQDSIKFKLYKEEVLIDQETIPIVRDGADGLDGFGSVIVDMDNEMASVACDAEGNVVSGLPVATTLSMFYGTEKLSIKSYSVKYKDNFVSVSFNMDTGILSVTSIGKDSPDNMRVTIELTASYEGKDYKRETTFVIIKVKPGANGENAILYQLAPTANTIKVSKSGSLSPSSLQCYINKIDGNNVTRLSSLPSGYTMKYKEDNGSETSYTYGSSIPAGGNNISIIFKLYKGSTVIDQETIPVVKDGKDGQDGGPGSPGAPGEQGIQGCVIRTSLWKSGTSYVNQSNLTTSSIRYIDVALIENSSYDTGYAAYICKKDHTSSSSNKPGVSSTYWEAVGYNVSSIFANTVISKNAVFKFSQAGQLLLMDSSNNIKGGASGGFYHFWAGAEQPSEAPFRVDKDGNVTAENGKFGGDLTAKTLTLKRDTNAGDIDGAVVVVGLSSSESSYIRFPALSDSQVRVVDIIGLRISRTSSAFELSGFNSNVLLAPDLSILDARQIIRLSNIQGCHFKAMGYYNNGKTYWNIIAMNDEATKSLSSAT